MGRAPIVLAAACALLVAGCGGSGGEVSEPAPAPAPAPAASRPAPAPSAVAPSAVAPKQRRLKRAGYDATASGVEGVEPQPAAALEFALDRGGQVTVYAYRSPADARTKAREFRALARRYPAYYRVAVRGSTTYVGSADEPEKLDVKGFDDAVARAEGR